MTTASRRARPAGRRRRRWLSLLAVPALAALGVLAIAHRPAAPAAGQLTRLDAAAAPADSSVMTWSINWDASNGYNFANTVAPHLASLP
jgi:hypothetical protein